LQKLSKFLRHLEIRTQICHEQRMQTLHPYIENKQHIIWDWNGTLLQDVDHALQVTNRLLAEENLPTITLSQYKKLMRFPVIHYYKDLGFDTSERRFPELCERFNQYFHAGVKDCGLWPGAKQTLQHIKQLGKRQSILSASEHGLLVAQVEMFDLDPLLDFVMGLPDKAANSKVERGHQLMKAANCAPSKTILIGDTDHDLEVGQALGIEVILVEHGHQEPERLRRVHSQVVRVF
jgi:phosphoglycolate phosphatase